jgi:hypothetical protein
VGREDHLRIQDLKAGDVLTIVTHNHRYQFAVTDPARNRATVTSDHPEFPGPYDGYLQGSVIHPESSTMMVGRVMVGFHIIWSTPDLLQKLSPPIFMLTSTQEVLVNGFRVLPAAHDGTLQ